jgi:hypothetical protein
MSLNKSLFQNCNHKKLEEEVEKYKDKSLGYISWKSDKKELIEHIGNLYSSNYDIILSEILPDELPKEISNAEYSYIIERIIFIEPSIDNNSQYAGSKDKDLIIIYDEYEELDKSVSVLIGSEKVISQKISSTQDIYDCNLEKYRKVAYFSKNPILLQFVYRICIANNSNYHPITSQNFYLRLNICDTQINNYPTHSIRNFLKDLIISPKGKDNLFEVYKLVNIRQLCGDEIWQNCPTQELRDIRFLISQIFASGNSNEKDLDVTYKRLGYLTNKFPQEIFTNNFKIFFFNLFNKYPFLPEIIADKLNEIYISNQLPRKLKLFQKFSELILFKSYNIENYDSKNELLKISLSYLELEIKHDTNPSPDTIFLKKFIEKIQESVSFEITLEDHLQELNSYFLVRERICKYLPLFNKDKFLDDYINIPELSQKNIESITYSILQKNNFEINYIFINFQDKLYSNVDHILGELSKWPHDQYTFTALQIMSKTHNEIEIPDKFSTELKLFCTFLLLIHNKEETGLNLLLSLCPKLITQSFNATIVLAYCKHYNDCNKIASLIDNIVADALATKHLKVQNRWLSSFCLIEYYLKYNKDNRYVEYARLADSHDPLSYAFRASLRSLDVSHTK